MNIETRKNCEKRIAKEFITVALAAGYSISLDNGGDGFEFKHSVDKAFILKEMFATDEERLYLSKDGKHVGWVLFVYGNDGYDAIADYTTNLEDLMPTVDAISSKLEEQYA